MSNIVFSDIVIKSTAIRPLGLLQLNMDTDAERFLLMDRRTFTILHSGINTPSNVVKLLQPLEFTIGHYCILGVVDDHGVYDCKFADGLKLELVDANTVDMSQ